MTTEVVKRKSNAGRKPALVMEPTHEAVLLDYIKIGVPIKKAVVAAGISEKSFYVWLNRGMAERERLATVPNAKADITEGVFVQFLQRVEQARGEAIAKKVAVVAKSSVEGDWRAAAWWLERQLPEEFGKTDKVELAGNNGDAIRVQIEMGDLEDKIAKVLAHRKK